MNEYARCAKHNLMRCGTCNRPPKVTAPAPATSVPAVGFDPSFNLPEANTMVGGTVAVAPDAQALEAMERNKAILMGAESPVKEVVSNFPTLSLESSAEVIDIYKRNANADSPFVRVVTIQPNPIVTAAQEYAQAQVVAQMATRKVETLRLELQQAENAAADAIADRDVKKTVIAKLVAS